MTLTYIIPFAFIFMTFIYGPDKASASTILGSAEGVALLGASTVTNTGATTIYGDLDLYSGTSITGSGTISQTGTTNDTNGVAELAQTDATKAYNILAALSSTSNLSGQDLGGLTLVAGDYDFNTSAQLTGALTLNFAGASNEDIVIQIGSTLTTAAGSSVVVENGNPTDGVFFQVGSSATLGAGTVFEGNILALNSVSFGSAAEILCGRAIALTGAVTMIGNTVSNNCAGAGSEGSGIGDAASVGWSGGDFTSLGYTNGEFDGSPSQQLVATAPEPSTLWLSGFSLMGIIWLATRPKKRVWSNAT